MDARNSQSQDQAGESAVNAAAFTVSKLPFFALIYLTVVGLCTAGMLWICRRRALQLWDRHPRGGEEYALGLF